MSKLTDELVLSGLDTSKWRGPASVMAQTTIHMSEYLIVRRALDRLVEEGKVEKRQNLSYKPLFVYRERPNVS